MSIIGPSSAGTSVAPTVSAAAPDGGSIRADKRERLPRVLLKEEESLGLAHSARVALTQFLQILFAAGRRVGRGFGRHVAAGGTARRLRARGRSRRRRRAAAIGLGIGAGQHVADDRPLNRRDVVIPLAVE